MSKITVVGVGPGCAADITRAAVSAIEQADAVLGYSYYLQFVRPYVKDGAEVAESGMRRERERAAEAFRLASEGRDVAVVSSGDSGIYGMASLIMQMAAENGSDVAIEVVPGISAFQKAASLLGAPAGHDLCLVSLSDLLTPWPVIERRIRAAAEADFVTAVYNPHSHGRFWQLMRLREIFLESRDPETPVGIVRQAGRPDEQVRHITLSRLSQDDADMFTVIIIGNSQTFTSGNRMITPRGYYSETADADADSRKPGQVIMGESFRTILRELGNPDMPAWRLWPLLHAIHTTADFEMARILKVDPDAPARIYDSLTRGGVRTIVTDVTMAASGVRRGALERLGIEVKCYLNHPDVITMASRMGITRSQAGIRLAVAEHPDALYAFGNAPTALAELVALTRSGAARPCGIIASPVGFVNVCESKHAVKTLTDVPKIIVDGRKGGSNIAATLVNSILCWPDAATLTPGRDL